MEVATFLSSQHLRLTSGHCTDNGKTNGGSKNQQPLFRCPRASTRTQPAAAAAAAGPHAQGALGAPSGGAGPLIPLSRGSKQQRERLKQGKRALTFVSSSSSSSLAASVAEELPAAVAEASSGGPGGAFVWEANWYPVALVRDLDKKIPEAVTILGLPMVVWWDRVAGTWRVFQDLCPHRLAPLSEGRIHESGALQCSYHGWTFSGQGACTWIPQAPPDGPPVNMSSRACVRVYPSREHQGMVFVWPQLLSPESLALSDATPLPTIPALDNPDFETVTGQAMQNYGYDTLVENLMDPAHVPFAHHNVNNQGNRNRSIPVNLAVRAVNSVGVEAVGREWEEVRFQAPSLILFRSNLAALTAASQEHRRKLAEAGLGQGGPGSPLDGKNGALKDARTKQQGQMQGQGKGQVQKILTHAFHCVPVSPGRSKLFYFFSRHLPPLKAKLTPRWLTHIGQILVLDSDHYLLHLQERLLAAEARSNTALSVYFTPTRSDALVCGFRKWLKDVGGGGVSWPPHVLPHLPPVLPKRQLLDRQLNHVRLCKSCQRAQKWFQGIALCLKVAAFLCAAQLLVRCALPSQVVGLAAAAVSVLASACLAGLAALVSKFVSKTYYFHDYVHALVP